MTEGTGQHAITLPRLIGSRGRLRGRIGAQRRVRAARGEGCFFSILSCFVVVRCAGTAQGEKRSRLGGRCVYLLRQGCNSPGPAR
jgi:hypothetical protein